MIAMISFVRSSTSAIPKLDGRRRLVAVFVVLLSFILGNSSNTQSDLLPHHHHQHQPLLHITTDNCVRRQNKQKTEWQDWN